MKNAPLQKIEAGCGSRYRVERTSLPGDVHRLKSSGFSRLTFSPTENRPSAK